MLTPSLEGGPVTTSGDERSEPVTAARPDGALARLRRFNRFELKYLMTAPAAERFKLAIAPYVERDPHAGPDGRYHLASLYYDTPDRQLYWEKIDGIRFRRKLRIRTYHDGSAISAESPVFVEIKQRLNRVTQKRRAALPYASALSLCRNGEIPDHDPADTDTIEEIAGMVAWYGLEPSAVTLYAREAFVGGDEDAGLRVTFDGDLRYRVGRRLALHSPDAGAPMVNPAWLILEIKVNERIPYWITELVAEHNCRLIRVSKYCQALEAGGAMPRSIFFLDDETPQERGGPDG